MSCVQNTGTSLISSEELSSLTDFTVRLYMAGFNAGFTGLEQQWGDPSVASGNQSALAKLCAETRISTTGSCQVANKGSAVKRTSRAVCGEPSTGIARSYRAGVRH